MRGGSTRGSLGSNEPPSTDLLNLLVPIVFDTQRSCASLILLHNLGSISCIDIAISVFSGVSNLFNVSEGGAS